MRLAEQGKLYQKIKCNRMEINAYDFDKDMDKDFDIRIVIGNAIRKTAATHFLDEAKADFPRDAEDAMNWFVKWFGKT